MQDELEQIKFCAQIREAVCNPVCVCVCVCVHVCARVHMYILALTSIVMT